MKRVAVSGAFDDLRGADVRFLEEASKIGDVSAFVWDDAFVRDRKGQPPKFPAAERGYIIAALRFVRRTVVSPGLGSPSVSAGASVEPRPDVWAVQERDDDPEHREFCKDRGIEYRLIPDDSLREFPGPPPHLQASDLPSPVEVSRKKVIVTGCYDWFHSGHVRFFEEASAYGDLYVDVGSDANIRLLKGEGHPLFSQAERVYLVRAVRRVHRAFIGTGVGWMDAAPEIELLKPDYYIVNEDGDRPEKREFCSARGIEYVVLQRTPAAGLPRRDSTTLRGF